MRDTRNRDDLVGMAVALYAGEEAMRNRRLSSDEALIALMIAAMESSGNVAAAEAARAQALVRLMPQFRKHTRPAIGRMIERMRIYVRDRDDAAIIAAAREAIPRDARPAAFMTVGAVLLSDDRLQVPEAAFLKKLSAALIQNPAQDGALS